LDRALSIDTNNLPARLLRARLLWQLAEYRAAETDLNLCLKQLRPQTPPKLRAEIYLLKGRVSGKRLRFDDAVNYYQKLLRLYPGYPGAEKELRQMTAYRKYGKGLGSAAKEILLKKEITRADLAALLAARLRFLVDSAQSAVNTPSSSSAAMQRQADIALAVSSGWLPLFPDSSFKPNSVVDRARFTLCITNMLLKYRPDSLWKARFSGRRYSDINPDNPLYPYIKLATAFHLVDFIDGEAFLARRPLNGLEAIKSIQRLSELLKAPSLPMQRQG